MENKKKISATIIADSKNQFGNRITSIVCTFPRIILAEAKTHRVISGLLGETTIIEESVGVNDEVLFSRNSASSRAIPFIKMVKSVQEDPFIPIAWQKDHKGMQGTEYFTEQSDIDELVSDHLQARDYAVLTAFQQANKGLTKQICNRYLEPFMWHTCIITATEWGNFCKLRCPQYSIFNKSNKQQVFRSIKDAKTNCEFPDQNDSYWRSVNKGQAEIHMMALAEAIWDAMNESTPKDIKEGEWHIPFGDNIDFDKPVFSLGEEASGSTIGMWYDAKGISRELEKVKIATARCARVSYINYEGKDDYSADLELYDKLLKSGSDGAFHGSPFEHCAKAMSEDDQDNYIKQEGTLSESGWCKNFRGFISLRSMIEQ